MFSSVFGASAEAGADNESAVPPLPFLPALAAASEAEAQRVESSVAAPVAAPVARAVAADKQTPSRTMAETNPWLIDHAYEIVNKPAAHSTKPLTPAAAVAKGLGVPTGTPEPLPQRDDEPAGGDLGGDARLGAAKPRSLPRAARRSGRCRRPACPNT